MIKVRHAKLPQFKYCCKGQHAELITPIKSVTKKGIVWRRGLYRCRKCKGYSIRGEADQLDTWNTLVELISKERAYAILESKRKFVERMKKSNEKHMGKQTVK